MDRTNDFQALLAPESAIGSMGDGHEDFALETDSYADPADELLDGLAASGLMYDDGGERHVREVLGRVFGL
jgi:hypothetical protein